MSQALASSANPFVGRTHELAELSAGVAHALAGRGRLVLLVGEPGIGKTRLASEIADHAASRGMRVLWGRCWEGEGAPTYWPWVQIIRGCVRDCEPARLRAEMGPGAADIAQVVSEVRERLPEVVDPPPLEGEQARFRLFDSITTFLKNVTKADPLLVVLEDLHWADKASLLLLQFLAREMVDVRLLVVGTYRDVEVQRSHPLAAALAAIRREPVHERILLRGLPETEVRELLTALGGAGVPEALVRAIFRESEGNPFFIEEILQNLVEEGSIGQERGHWTSRIAPDAMRIPESIRDVVGRRLNHLSKDCNEVLAIASVIGREFGLDALGRVSELPAERLVDLLEEATAASVVDESPRAPGHYGFTHTLIRETLYSELRTTRRVLLHRRIAEVLEELYARDPEPHLAELAYHFSEAAHAGGDPNPAIGYAERAAGRAAALLAYDEAATQYERALELLELEQADEERRCDLLLALGGVYRKAGEAEGAERAFQRAAEIAKQCGTPEKLARAALGYAGKWIFSPRMCAATVRLLEEALAALGSEDSPLRAMVMARLASELVYQHSQWDRRTALAEEAVTIARRVGDGGALAYALFRLFASRPWGDWARKSIADLTTDGADITRLSRDAGDEGFVHLGYMWRMEEALRRGRIEEVDADIAAAVRHAEELRQPYYVWWTTVLRASRAILDGRFADGERLSLHALAMGRRMQNPGAIVACGGQMFILRWQQGRLDELEAPLQRIAGRHPEVSAVRCTLAVLNSELGREHEARSALEELVTSDWAGVDWGNTMLGPFWLGEACASLGDARHAATLYDALSPYPWPVLASGTVLECLGASARVLGILAATMSRWEDAQRHFEDALDVHAKLRARPFLARTQLDYARMLVGRDQTGDHDRALDLLDRGIATARELGMQRVAERALALKEQARRGAPTASPRPVPATAPSRRVLRREGDTWSIAYEGASFRLRDGKGLHYIAHLLRHPGREFHVADLLAVITPNGVDDSEPVRAAALGHAGEVLDLRAKSEYRRRMDELRADLDQASEWGDLGRAARLREELETLTRQLAGAYGLGGRARKAGDQVERVRKAVTGRIRDSIARIQKESPSLALHLTNAVRLGTFCTYVPEDPASWTL